SQPAPVAELAARIRTITALICPWAPRSRTASGVRPASEAPWRILNETPFLSSTFAPREETHRFPLLRHEDPRTGGGPGASGRTPEPRGRVADGGAGLPPRCLGLSQPGQSGGCCSHACGS